MRNIVIVEPHSTGMNFIQDVIRRGFRLVVLQMKNMDDIPVSVSINEAVEICKKYATEADASFVNGILSTVAKKG